MPFPAGMNYRNVAISKQSAPTYEYRLPDDFLNARERFIVVRQARATFELTTQPFGFMLNDVMLMSDLACESDLATPEIDATFNATRHSLGYIAICNDANMKKKKFAYVWRDAVLHFAFARLDGLPIIPTLFLIDLLLVWK
jgi:hypothetical protein